MALIFRRKSVNLGHHFLWDLLTLDNYSATFVWFCLFYRTPDLYVSCRATFFKSSRFRIASTTRHLSQVVCNLAYCRIGATSAQRLVQYNPPIRLLDQVFSILSTQGFNESRYRSQIEDTFRSAFRRLSATSLLPAPQVSCIIYSTRILAIFNKSTFLAPVHLKRLGHAENYLP